MRAVVLMPGFQKPILTIQTAGPTDRVVDFVAQS
jgi:hypothetical protein